jgi:RNA polymerase sigma factor (sigma-70 family)
MAFPKKDPCAAFPTEQSLFEALQRHIRQAQECLYKRGLALVLSNLTQKGGNEEDIRDAFQEGILAFSLKINNLELRGKVTTILYAFVRNKWVDMLRRQGIRPKEEKLTPLKGDESNSIYWNNRVRESESEPLPKKPIPLPENFDPQSQSPDPLEELLNSDLQEAVRAYLRTQAPRTNELGQLLLFEGVALEDAAKQLGITTDSVYNQKCRFIKRLRTALKHLR